MGGDVILAHVYILLYIKLICTVTYILTYTVYRMVWGSFESSIGIGSSGNMIMRILIDALRPKQCFVHCHKFIRILCIYVEHKFPSAYCRRGQYGVAKFALFHFHGLTIIISNQPFRVVGSSACVPLVLPRAAGSSGNI